MFSPTRSNRHPIPRASTTALLVVTTACTSSDWTLTPLAVRPEEPDSVSIADQNDFLADASPDGTQIAFGSRQTGQNRIHVMRVDGTDRRVITRAPGEQYNPSWSSDGSRIAYIHTDEGRFWIGVMNADGSSPRLLLEITGRDTWPPDWSPDDRRLMFTWTREGNPDIWTIDIESGDTERLVGSDGIEVHGSYSPDGRQIAFVSTRDASQPGGRSVEIFIASVDGGLWTRLTYNQGGEQPPEWSPDGSTLVYNATSGGRWAIYTMNVDGSRQIPITRYPMQWDPDWSHDGSQILFNSMRDGRRGLYIMNADGSDQRKLTNTEPSSFVTVVEEAGVDEAVRAYNRARARHPEATFFYEREVEYLGDMFLEVGFHRQAILLFEINVNAYPDSKTAHAKLSEAQLAAGQIDTAIASYERALELDPEDQRLQALVARLRSQGT